MYPPPRHLVVKALELAANVSICANASEISSPSRVVVHKLFLGSVSPLVTKYEFLKTHDI